MRLMVGVQDGSIRDDEIRKELLNESKLTLESCITMVKSAAATACQAKNMS